MKSIYKVLILLITLILTGCSSKAQIEDRDFVLAVGIGYENYNYKVSFARPNLSVLTGQSAPENQKLTVMYRGINFSQIQKDYKRSMEKQLDYSHMKAWIFDKGIINNQDKMKDVIYYFENNYEISRNALVFFTDDMEELLIGSEGEVDGNLGEYLEKIQEQRSKKSKVTQTTVGDLMNTFYEKDKVISIPKVVIDDKKPIMLGSGLFKNAVLVKELSEKETEHMNIALSAIKDYEITLEDEQVICIENLKSEYIYSFNDKKPELIISINGRGKVLYGMGNETVDSIRLETEREVGEIVRKTVKELIKDDKVDFMNLYRRSAYKEASIWKKYKEDEIKFLEDVTIRIGVNIVLDNL